MSTSDCVGAFCCGDTNGTTGGGPVNVGDVFLTAGIMMGCVLLLLVAVMLKGAGYECWAHIAPDPTASK